MAQRRFEQSIGSGAQRPNRLLEWQLVQVDCNIIAERPRLGPYKTAMRHRLAELCSLDLSCVGLKARSHEKVDATGAGDAIQAQVIVQVLRK